VRKGTPEPVEFPDDEAVTLLQICKTGFQAGSIILHPSASITMFEVEDYSLDLVLWYAACGEGAGVGAALLGAKQKRSARS